MPSKNLILIGKHNVCEIFFDKSKRDFVALLGKKRIAQNSDYNDLIEEIDQALCKKPKVEKGMFVIWHEYNNRNQMMTFVGEVAETIGDEDYQVKMTNSVGVHYRSHIGIITKEEYDAASAAITKLSGLREQAQEVENLLYQIRVGARPAS